MADEDRGRDLPQRVRGAARPGPHAGCHRRRRRCPRNCGSASRRPSRPSVPRRPSRSSTGPRAATSRPRLSNRRNGHSQRERPAQVRRKPELRCRSRRAEPERLRRPRVTKTEVVKPPPATGSSPLQTGGAYLQPAPALSQATIGLRYLPAKPAGCHCSPRGRVTPATRRRHRAWRAEEADRRRIGAGLVSFVLVASSSGRGRRGGHAFWPARHPAARRPVPPRCARRRWSAVRPPLWVAQQVSHDVTVSCDEVMCAALEARGFPSRPGRPRPTLPDPVPSVVVVETAAVRDTVRQHPRHRLGAGCPRRPSARAPRASPSAWSHLTAPLRTGPLLRATWPPGRKPGPRLLNDPQITLSAAARNELAAGQVDSRLVLALASLAGRQPISIVQFGNIGPGAAPVLPLRFGDLAENDQAAHLSRSAYARSVRGYLSTASPCPPGRTVTVVAARRPRPYCGSSSPRRALSGCSARRETYSSASCPAARATAAPP